MQSAELTYRHPTQSLNFALPLLEQKWFLIPVIMYTTVILSYLWKTWFLMSHILAAILLWETLIFLQCPGPLTSAYIHNIS